MSVLDIPTELDWNTQVTSLSMWPLSLSDDGLLVYFRCQSIARIVQAHCSDWVTPSCNQFLILTLIIYQKLRFILNVLWDYSRDKTEKTGELSEDKKKELQQQENVR
jgi:hypothetical protein